MNIRPATISDASAIAEIHVATWRAAYRDQMPAAVLDALDVSQRTEFWHTILSEEHAVSVAVHASEIIGFCSVIPSRDHDAAPGAIAEIAALYVHPRHWRRGAARALCTQAFATSTAAGYTRLTLWVLATNHPALAFYEALGFTPDGVTKHEPDPSPFPFDELRLARELAPG